MKTRDGFEMNAMLVKPRDFDPRRKYPVLMFVYSGPHSQTVRNAWGGATGMSGSRWRSTACSWSCDNRTASGKGARSAWPCYQKLGVSELADIEDSIAWLKSQGFVDDSHRHHRLELRRLQRPAMRSRTPRRSRSGRGRFRDRLAQLRLDLHRALHEAAQNNESGYDQTSVVKAASKPVRQAVLVHGAIDDNVHPQNTLRLAFELQKHNADFGADALSHVTARRREPAPEQHWRATMLRALRDTWGIDGLL
ncbi:MAG: prolyl oligopeptidase family serine peptidase [Candidatus Binatia bacterium]